MESYDEFMKKICLSCEDGKMAFPGYSWLDEGQRLLREYRLDVDAETGFF